jgi:hypothetical protein
MNARPRTILICSVSLLMALLVFPLTVAAQSAYSVIDLGTAPEPVVPEPYNRNADAGVEFMTANPSGQTIISRFITGNIGAFFWEPGLTTPIRIGSQFDSYIVAAISSNGYFVGIVNGGHPFVMSSKTSRESLLPIGDENAWPLAVNASAVVVGFEYGSKPTRAVVWQARTLSDAGVITGIGRLTTSTGVVEPHYFALTPTGSNDGALNRSDWTASATESAPTIRLRTRLTGTSTPVSALETLNTIVKASK